MVERRATFTKATFLRKERTDNQLPSGRRSAEEYVSMESAEAETARIALDNMDDILDSMDRLVEKMRRLRREGE